MNELNFSLKKEFIVKKNDFILIYGFAGSGKTYSTLKILKNLLIEKQINSVLFITPYGFVGDHEKITVLNMDFIGTGFSIPLKKMFDLIEEESVDAIFIDEYVDFSIMNSFYEHLRKQNILLILSTQESEISNKMNNTITITADRKSMNNPCCSQNASTLTSHFVLENEAGNSII